MTELCEGLRTQLPCVTQMPVALLVLGLVTLGYLLIPTSTSYLFVLASGLGHGSWLILLIDT